MTLTERPLILHPKTKKPILLERLCQQLESRVENSNFGVHSREMDSTDTESRSVFEPYQKIEYYCTLTGEKCVGSIPEQHPYQQLLVEEVVLRCPSLKLYGDKKEGVLG